MSESCDAMKLLLWRGWQWALCLGFSSFNGNATIYDKKVWKLLSSGKNTEYTAVSVMLNECITKRLYKENKALCDNECLWDTWECAHCITTFWQIKPNGECVPNSFGWRSMSWVLILKETKLKTKSVVVEWRPRKMSRNEDDLKKSKTKVNWRSPRTKAN